MKKFLSSVLTASLMLTQGISALAAETVHCRINDTTITAINTALPGVQTSGDTTYYVGTGEVISYDTHESKAENSLPGLYNILQSGESGWVKTSSETRPIFTKENSDTSVLFPMIKSNAQIAYYTFNKDFGYSGKFSLEYKVKSDATAIVDLRLISTASSNAGWDQNYQIVYSFLRFYPDKFTYQNVARKPDASGDNITSYTVNGIGLNEWITLRFDFNTDEKSYDVYINGSRVGENVSFHYGDLPENLMTDSQKASNDLGFMRVREGGTAANVSFDDIAIYNTESETSNYFALPQGAQHYTAFIGDKLYDIKTPVSITDANGVPTGKTAYVPVRLSDADTSEFGIQKVQIDGYSQKATVSVNKKSENLSENFESYKITDASAGVQFGSTGGHSVQKETFSDGTSNQYMQIYKSSSWSALLPSYELNSTETPYDLNFKLRFPEIDGFKKGTYFLSFQLNNGNIDNIVTFNFEPKESETSEKYYYNRVRVSIPASADNTFAGKSTFSLWVPATVDWSAWHDVSVRMKDGKMSVYFDEAELLADEPVRTDISFNRIKLAHRGSGAEKIEGISNLDDISVTAYPSLSALSDISHTTALSNITVPDKVTASLSDSTSVMLPISSVTPLDGAPMIKEITQCGTYRYTITAEGFDKTAVLTLTVIDKAYSLGTPYIDESTKTVAVPVQKATMDTEPVQLITARYRENTLEDISILPISGNGNIVTTVKPEDGTVIKVFLWNNLSSLTPVCEEVSVSLPAESYENLEEYDIVCWGDSLTYGHIEDADPPTLYSYPTVLASLTGKSIKNMGIGGETATTIAVRQGGLTLAPSGSFTLGSAAGSSVTFTEGSFNDLTGGSVVPRSKSGYSYGWEGTCYLNGIAGKITNLLVDDSVTPRKLISLTFTRLTDGEALIVNEGEQRIFIPNGNFVKGDINVIFVGQNGWHDADNDGETDDYDLVAIIDKMVDACPDKNKTLIIGLATGSAESRKSLEEAMTAAYGERYINLRAHLSSVETLESAGITPTDEDLVKIAAGEMPISLRRTPNDYVHMNASGNSIVANRIYKAMCDLGYLD